MQRLQEAIEKKDMKTALQFIREKMKSSDSFKLDLTHYKCSQLDKEKNQAIDTDETDDTILHLATAILDESHNRIIEEIVKISPELLASSKGKDHQGQTPLHILIARKHNDTLKIIKMLSKREIGANLRRKIFNPNVTGTVFRNTIMEGDLPFIVAALTLDTETAEVVIEMTEQSLQISQSNPGQSSDINVQNSNGNTVYHCLIEHAARHPDEIQKVIAMWDFLSRFAADGSGNKYMQTALRPEKVFHLTNLDNMRPLQLAAYHGVPKLFNMILNQEKLPNVEDRLFDSYLFDVSVIDTVSHFKLQLEEKAAIEQKKSTKQNQVGTTDNPTGGSSDSKNEVEVGRAITNDQFQFSQSVLEMLCNRNVARNKNSVFEIIRQPPMKKLIKCKWNSYKCRFRIWMFFHVLIMVLYSLHAVQWSHVAFPSNSTHPGTTDLQREFVLGSSIVLLLVGIVYCAITVLLIVARFRRPDSFVYFTNDLEYIILLLLFSVCLVADVIWYYIHLQRGTTFLLISLLSGWWFIIFFCRAYRSISFYVAMIHRVIFGDLLRFGLFIVLSLVSFSIAFQVLFPGGPDIPTAYGSEDDTSDAIGIYVQTFFSNIRLMFGQGGIEDYLHKAREPFMAYIVYIVYVIMTHLILMNSLIALISETCASVRENEMAFYHTQRLSVILFLEEICYPFWYCSTRWLESLFELRPVTRNCITFNRYFLKMADKNPKNQSKSNAPSNVNQDQIFTKNTESLTIKIIQPVYEEMLDDETKTVKSRLRWNDENQTTTNL
ncbi:transient receptor potential cation channel subfamily V member 2-like [Pecten maximus]|uniref:transient receptor potential cation channel subfamily V member 2-like n=1 Tax=Pecten maximus TaxID=6579 RepID=UPI001458D4EE|nr:transient receptor potential cation channel subfamily V member 2-like [Pecten maximus]